MMFIRFRPLIFLPFFCLPLLHAEEPSTLAERPNILVLIGDDIDRDSLGPWGGQAITPHLNQLAADGMRFDRVYANVAMCAPFRQEFYSGRSAWRTRAMPNHSRSVADTKSLPHYLRPLGYKVGLLGKSHVGPQAAYPFDRVGGLNANKDANGEALRRAREYATSARDNDQPFCLVVAANDGHAPFTTGDQSLYNPAKLKLPADAIDTPVYRETLAKHLAEVTNLDALLGTLRAMLAEEKLAENTLVLYSSEQGNQFPFGKWTCFNDGLASGIVAALPGKIPPGKTCDRLAWISDLVPTFIEAAGGTVTPADFDGRSQWANFLGANEPVHPFAYGAFVNCNIIDNRERVFPVRCIRDERYTLIWSPRADEEHTSNTTLTKAFNLLETDASLNGQADPAASWVLKFRETNDEAHRQIVHRFHHRDEWEFYDRQTDPEELTNLADSSEHAADRKRLEKALNAWLAKWDDEDPVATERTFVKGKKKRSRSRPWPTTGSTDDLAGPARVQTEMRCLRLSAF